MRNREAEKSFETGMDESYKNTAAEGTGQRSGVANREDDRAVDFDSSLKQLQLRKQELDIAEREQGLVERRNREAENALSAKNREYSIHMANLKQNDHYTFGYDKLNNLEAVESRSNALVLEGEAGLSIRAAIAAEVQKAVAEIKK